MLILIGGNMRIKIEPKWYGAKLQPYQTRYEREMIRKYQERLREKRIRGDPKGSFNPVEGPYAKIYDVEVSSVKGYLKENDIIIDIGAGEGRLVEAALQIGVKKIIAMDPDQLAIETLKQRFGKDIEIIRGFAQNMHFLADKSVDVSVSLGNTFGVLWDVEENWGRLVCRQKEALLEMIRITRREIIFTVYGKETTESSLKAYEPLYRNVIAIVDGLMLIEEKGDDAPYLIQGEGEKKISRFVFQKFDRIYLENLLRDCGLCPHEYSIKSIPEGTEYGFLIRINLR